MKKGTGYNLTGVVHLPPMPGYPTSPGIEAIINFAIEEARTLEMAGFSGVLVENEGDRPHLLKVSEKYINNACQVIKALKASTSLPVGLEILYDMVATVRVGIAAQADFVRLDVFTDDTEVRWGVVKECTSEIAHLRREKPQSFPEIWADVHVKHGRNLSQRSLAESARLAVQHGASVLIVTGDVTGEPPTVTDCHEMRAHASALPVFVGSGFSADNAQTLCGVSNGTVVATTVQINGRFDLHKCTELAKVVARYVGEVA